MILLRISLQTEYWVECTDYSVVLDLICSGLKILDIKYLDKYHFCDCGEIMLDDAQVCGKCKEWR